MLKEITPKKTALALVILAVVFNAVFLWSEVSISTFNLNDEVLHQAAAKAASSVLKEGFDLTDFWFSKIELGFPLFHYYQHLPQITLAAINQLTSLFFPLSRLFDLFRYLLLVLFPLSIFLAMRRFGFDYLAAGLAALISSLLSTNGLFGLDYGSYIWRGSGLHTQLWAMFFLPLALAEIYRVIFQKNKFFLAVLFSAIVFLSNVVYGYILLLSTVLFLLLASKKEIVPILKRAALLLFLLALVASYFWLPFLLDKNYLNRSVWEAAYKYDSFGAKKILSDLFTGQIFDYGRIPFLTILFFLSLIVIVVLKRYRQANCRFLLIFTFFWLLLYFGRPTWDGIFSILPFSQDLHLHRLIGAFHFGAIMIIGVGLSLAWQYLKKYPLKILTAAGFIFLAILAPSLIERAKFYQQNSQWKIESQKAIFSQEKEISEIKKTLKDLLPSRVYVGLPADFGDDPAYKIGSVPLYSLLPQLDIESFGYAFFALPLSTDVRLHFDNGKLEQYNLFNIRYILLHKTWTAPPFYFKMKELENYVLYEVPTTGYFDLVDVPAVFYGKKNDFYSPNSKWLFSSLPQLKQHPILEIGKEPKETFNLPTIPFSKVDEKVLLDLAPTKDATERGGILNERMETNQYWTQFFVNHDCYLMLKTNYHPGWQVSLDYQKVEPVMLAPGFIGIKVTPGVHQALFSYQPSNWRFPLLLFGIFILLILFYDYSIKHWLEGSKVVKLKNKLKQKVAFLKFLN